MKTNDKDFLNELRQEVTKENISLPDALSAENISKLVKDEPMKKKSNKTIYRITALAASFAVVLGVGIFAFNNYEPKIKPIAPSEKNNTESVYTSEYTEIQSFFKSLRKNYSFRDYAVDGSFNLFNSSTGTLKGEASEGMNTGAATDDLETDGFSFNETNAQVKGVLEADIIQNDGRYLYIVHQNDASKVVIVDAKDPKSLKSVAKISLPENDSEYTTATDIFLYGDKLIILTGTYNKPDTDTYNKYGRAEICCFEGSRGEKSGVVIYDISKKFSPKKTAEYSLDGGYVTTRLTGETLILITNYFVPLYNDDEELNKACIPSYFIGGKEFKIPADNISIIEDNKENTYTVILKINLNNQNANPDATAILGGTADIYCTKSDLYLSRAVFNETDINNPGLETEIFRFEFTNGIEYKSSVKIPGSVLNQFSMDEYNGFFRIATSDANVQSYITVLDKDLNIIGQLDGIAPKESIYAVRFLGDTAYVVTFYQTDPLFVIDLSNPTAPEIVGELKIPGFSNMLHPYADGLLIGIGVDGNENGANGKVKVSLFDVSDKTNPKEISKAVVDGGSYSAAQYNHKAFMKFSDTGEFAIPVIKYTYNSNGEESYYICSFRIENGSIASYKKYEVDNAGYDMRSAYINNTVFVLCGNELYSFDRDSTELLQKFKLLDESEINDNLICLY